MRNLRSRRLASAVAVSEVGTVGLVGRQKRHELEAVVDSANGIMNGNIISIAAFASTPLHQLKASTSMSPAPAVHCVKRFSGQTFAMMLPLAEDCIAV
ncbi:hypothetical protein F2981_16670 [Sinorhizobium meliloti]|nr:hypothetical protein [Sinorhizobium meliloti]